MAESVKSENFKSKMKSNINQDFSMTVSPFMESQMRSQIMDLRKSDVQMIDLVEIKIDVRKKAFDYGLFRKV